MNSDPELTDIGRVRLCGAVGLASFATILFLIVAQADSRPPDMDETWYLETVPQFHQFGLTRAFLLALPGPAGPLYTWAHAAFEPLTGLRPVGTRLATAGLAAGTIFCVAAVLALRGVAFAGWRAWQLMAIPFVVTVVARAYTEMPAMLCFYGQLAILLHLLREAPAHPGRAVGLAIVAGLLLGLAILGRQQFLIALIFSPLLAIGHRAAWPALVAFAITAAILPAVVFRVWGGLMPPLTRYVQSGLVPGNGLLALAYAGVTYCVFDLSWVTRRSLLIAALILLGTAVLNVWLDIPTAGVPVRPGRTFVESVVSLGTAEIYYKLVRGLLLGLCVAFLVRLAVLAVRYRRDSEMLLFLLLIVSLPMSSARVTHTFTPRYSVVILPLVLLLTCETAKDTTARAGRLAVVGFWGLLRIGRGLVY